MEKLKAFTKNEKKIFNNGSAVKFFINGTPYQINPDEIPITTSLNSFIRNHAHLRGTKFMCLEGGCGACIVTLTGKHPFTEEYHSWAVNSCLTPVYSCDGLEVTTIEGIGNNKIGHHPIQKRLAQFHGTQCGYCSPGMVMNMYSLLLANNEKLTMEDIENSFGGNICRCTGYRPILDAFKSFAVDADPKYKTMCGDIEDITTGIKVCPKTGNKCNGSTNCINDNQKCNEENIHLRLKDNKEWHKVKKIDEIFKIFQSIDKKSYILIAGNTAHGVYRRNPNIDIYIDINAIKELHSHKLNDKKLILGANINLTETMNIFEKASKHKGFEYCKNLKKHIDLIANVPVRNSGTLAGNLSIKHSHPEFPSDLFLILATVGAQLTIASNNSSKNVSLEKYLQTDMYGKIIECITLYPFNANKFKFISYKIMPRAQNAHAYVNAGFLFELETNSKVSSCKILYGGINSKFLHAENTEKYLVGKFLFDTNTIQNSIKILSEEIIPDWIKPDASPDYRKNLAIALFYKFILSICPNDKITPKYKSGGNILERPLSSGIQNFDTNKSRWPITQPIQKLESIIQCSGEAQYTNDIPYLPGQLWAAFVPAKKCHSKIVSIDPTNALKIPGVEYFFSAKNIPGINNFSPINMMMVHDEEEIFCNEYIKFYGQPVGIILANTFELANYAATIVKIEYEKSDKPVIPTIKEAYENNDTARFNPTPLKLEPKTEGKNIKDTFKGHFEMSGQYHFTMETQTTFCVPNEDCLDVYAATQWVDYVQAAISQCLNIPESSINLQVRRLGGAYGAKISRTSLIACACAIGAKLTNRPVRFVLSLESNMDTIGKRFGLISDYEVSIDENGKIQKLINNFSQDYGCSANEDVIYNTVEFFKNCYDSSTFKLDSKYVLTDCPSNTWCRAPGSTEGIAMIETIMEHIAKMTGLDPIFVRTQNIPDDSKMKSLLPEFLELCNYNSRKIEINEFNEANRWRKRGIAVVPMHYDQDFFGTIPVLVSIYHTDGTVAITHGGIECGQGINTKVAQVAAHTLDIPIEYIKIKPAINYVTPNSAVTGGSMTSEAVCYATLKACETLLERMKPVREEMKGAKWQLITDACFNKMIELSAVHMYKMTDVQKYTTWGLSCAEIEIDILTGNLMLRRVDILEDTGESLSPWIDVGQVEGAFVMGLGYWLTENLIYDQNTGELLTNRSWNYKPPGAKDIPVDFRIHFLRNSSNRLSILRSKATGEPALCMSIVALFALRYALESARNDAALKNEFLNLSAPTTAEDIFLKAGTKLTEFVL